MNNYLKSIKSGSVKFKVPRLPEVDFTKFKDNVLKIKKNLFAVIENDQMKYHNIIVFNNNKRDNEVLYKNNKINKDMTSIQEKQIKLLNIGDIQRGKKEINRALNFPIDDRTQCLKEDNVKELVKQIEKNIQLELK